MDAKTTKAINVLCAFLAKRDIESIDTAGHFDVLMVFGCDLPEVVECAVEAYALGKTEKLLFSGGIGHGTENLRANVKRRYGTDTDNLAEGDIMGGLAELLRVPRGDIIIENKSANSGENASFSLALLDEMGLPYDSILLVQDPFMQLRSHYSLKKHLGGGKVLTSYAPFIPDAGELDSHAHWSRERFFDLILREIPRVRDDENGYGPNGLGYIEHVDIPDNVLECYDIVSAYHESENSR